VVKILAGFPTRQHKSGERRLFTPIVDCLYSSGVFNRATIAVNYEIRKYRRRSDITRNTVYYYVAGGRRKTDSISINVPALFTKGEERGQSFLFALHAYPLRPDYDWRAAYSVQALFPIPRLIRWRSTFALLLSKLNGDAPGFMFE